MANDLCMSSGCSNPPMRAMLLCRQHIAAPGIGRAPAPVAAPVYKWLVYAEWGSGALNERLPFVNRADALARYDALLRDPAVSNCYVEYVNEGFDGASVENVEIGCDSVAIYHAPVAAPAPVAPQPAAVQPIECSVCDVGYLPHYSEPLPESLVTLCRVFRLCPECYQSPNTEHSAMCPDYLAGRGECTCCPGCFVVAPMLPGEHNCSMARCEHLAPTDRGYRAPCHSGLCPSSEPGVWQCCGDDSDECPQCGRMLVGITCPNCPADYDDDSDECPTCNACGGDVAPPVRSDGLCHACRTIEAAYASAAPVVHANSCQSHLVPPNQPECRRAFCTCVGGR